MSKPNLVVRWVEHFWTRMRRLDYWNDGIASHYPHKYYRATSPGSQPPAEVPISEPENVYSIRCNTPRSLEPFCLAAATSPAPPTDLPGCAPKLSADFHRDTRRKDVNYYPDTPLSLNHALMKGKPQRPSDAPMKQQPSYNAFEKKVSGHAAMWKEGAVITE